ncbi:hypothetical protein F5X68DRAFT_258437 [Plectosphaerella plurivora]|uniref:Uncharacterized protein n=1 Tax=Plectosphaerella plurivora TaxID=936078 RepID=A0A9P8VKF9_9PEZI|nr:hypothetical protein F5X68DRAFT_258437 [Plectosphaerella plurivora]
MSHTCHAFDPVDSSFCRQRVTLDHAYCAEHKKCSYAGGCSNAPDLPTFLAPYEVKPTIRPSPHHEFVCPDHECSMRGCNYPREPETIWCKSHAPAAPLCAFSGCGQQAAGSSKYCDGHSCAAKNCGHHIAEVEGNRNTFCVRHTPYCAVPNCRYLPLPGRKHCGKHGCEVSRCDGPALRDNSKGLTLCEKHRCAVRKCGNSVDLANAFCANHRCNTNGCTLPATHPRGYCGTFGHGCSVPKCRLPAAHRADMCQDHILAKVRGEAAQAVKAEKDLRKQEAAWKAEKEAAKKAQLEAIKAKEEAAEQAIIEQLIDQMRIEEAVKQQVAREQAEKEAKIAAERQEKARLRMDADRREKARLQVEADRRERARLLMEAERREKERLQSEAKRREEERLQSEANRREKAHVQKEANRREEERLQSEAADEPLWEADEDYLSSSSGTTGSYHRPSHIANHPYLNLPRHIYTPLTGQGNTRRKTPEEVKLEEEIQVGRERLLKSLQSLQDDISFHYQNTEPRERERIFRIADAKDMEEIKKYDHDATIRLRNLRKQQQLLETGRPLY